MLAQEKATELEQVTVLEQARAPESASGLEQVTVLERGLAPELASGPEQVTVLERAPALGRVLALAREMAPWATVPARARHRRRRHRRH